MIYPEENGATLCCAKELASHKVDLPYASPPLAAGSVATEGLMMVDLSDLMERLDLGRRVLNQKFTGCSPRVPSYDHDRVPHTASAFQPSLSSAHHRSILSCKYSAITPRVIRLQLYSSSRRSSGATCMYVRIMYPKKHPNIKSHGRGRPVAVENRMTLKVMKKIYAAHA